MAKCPVCNEQFSKSAHNQIFCSRNCQLKNYRSTTYTTDETHAAKNRERVQRYRDRKKQEQAKYKDKIRFDGNRELTLKRDNHQCQTCGTTEQLVVHHKDRSGQTETPNNDMSNLVTLCASCHQDEHRKDWSRKVTIKPCLHCGNDIEERSWEDRKYCSKSCQDASQVGKFKTSVLKPCAVCGTEFKAVAANVALGKAKYCSVKCSRIGQTKTVKLNCLVCGNEFETIPAKLKVGKGKVCSTKCSGVLRSKKMKEV